MWAPSSVSYRSWYFSHEHVPIHVHSYVCVCEHALAKIDILSLGEFFLKSCKTTIFRGHNEPKSHWISCACLSKCVHFFSSGQMYRFFSVKSDALYKVKFQQKIEKSTQRFCEKPSTSEKKNHEREREISTIQQLGTSLCLDWFPPST